MFPPSAKLRICYTFPLSAHGWTVLVHPALTTLCFIELDNEPKRWNVILHPQSHLCSASLIHHHRHLAKFLYYFFIYLARSLPPYLFSLFLTLAQAVSVSLSLSLSNGRLSCPAFYCSTNTDPLHQGQCSELEHWDHQISPNAIWGAFYSSCLSLKGHLMWGHFSMMTLQLLKCEPSCSPELQRCHTLWMANPLEPAINI